MCGIVGLVSPKLTAKERSNIVCKSLHEIAHRGELAYQKETSGYSGFEGGTNRLAFTSGSEPQPAISSSGRYMVFLNGEFYKHHKDSSDKSDTRIFADSLDRCNGIPTDQCGMFASIIVDKTENRLILTRDRFGVKPLYYARGKDSIIVASELKAITVHGEWNSINDVTPGKSLVFCLETMRLIDDICSAESVVDVGSTSMPDFETMAGRLRVALFEAVDLTTSDGHEYGMFLSGGIDSSAILAIASKLGKPMIPMVLGRKNSADVHYARTVAKRLGTHVHVIPCPEEVDLLRIIPKIIRSVESFEPNVVRQSAVSYILSRGAHALGIKVAICGEGADELFGGYPEFLSRTDEFASLRDRFIADLHRTQLQRVDRTSMESTLEVRVPFLLPQVANIALSTSDATLFLGTACGDRLTKRLLREAVGDLLPRQVKRRPKMVFSEGVGVRGNDPKNGMFADMIDRIVSDEQFLDIRNRYPEFSLTTKEEALYFSIYRSCGYHVYEGAKVRVTANSEATLETNFL